MSGNPPDVLRYIRERERVDSEIRRLLGNGVTPSELNRYYVVAINTRTGEHRLVSRELAEALCR